MSKNDLNRSIIALCQLKGIGRKKVKTILNSVDNPADYHLLELVEIGISTNVFSRNSTIGIFLDARKRADEILKCCEENNINMVNSYSEDFPEALRFEDGPDLIYYKGDLAPLANPNRAAVIGTRVPSDIGYHFAYNCGKNLAEQGYTVVSGLALGCDTAAHLGCLKAGGKTVAFLPSNLMNITPRENAELADRIIAGGGCIISEFSPLSTSNAYMFIERDRLQAAASNFVLTSEFARNSGTLHTLHFAHTYGKPIYADEAIVNSDVDGYDAMTEEGIAYQVGNMEEIKQFILKNRQ